jgi:hypothetical protein
LTVWNDRIDGQLVRKLTWRSLSLGDLPGELNV